MTQLTAYHILLHASSCLYISILNTDSLRPVRHTTGIFTYKNKYRTQHMKTTGTKCGRITININLLLLELLVIFTQVSYIML